jgi:ubiquinone/menaquinone biosynthesis C-methylase UbiE
MQTLQSPKPARQRLIPTDFDAIADQYDESLPEHVLDHYLRKRLSFIHKYTRPADGRVLDVGCGTGNLAERVAATGLDVAGVDLAVGMLRRLQRRRPAVPVFVADSSALPFRDDTFALTYCVAVLHHVADRDLVFRTLAEMVRVTRPGGRILVWDHNPRNPYWPILMRRVPQDTGAERLIPEREIRQGLRASGARIVFQREMGFVPDFAPKALLPLFRWIERVVEHVPLLRRLCAHNVILAVKQDQQAQSTGSSN